MRFLSGSKRFGSVKWFGSVSLVDFGWTLILWLFITIHESRLYSFYTSFWVFCENCEDMRER